MTEPNPRRGRALAILGTLAVVALLGLMALWTGVDALAARQSLNQARGEIAQAMGAITNGDVAVVQERLGAAAGHVDTARERTSGARWGVLARTPLLGRSADILRDVVSVADNAVSVGEALTEHGDSLFGADGRINVRMVDGVVDLGLVRDASAAISSVSTDGLADARDRLASRPATWVPSMVRGGRRDALELADQALLTLRRAEAALEVLPAFLGGAGERRYLLGMQTSAELRATGGLITYYSVLTVESGTIIVGESEIVDVTEEDQEPTFEEVGRLGRLGSARENVVDAPEAYLARYGHAAAAGHFSNVNLDPDLPTVAGVLLDLYAYRTDDTLDGVILTDPIGLALLLSSSGAVPVDPDVRDSDGRIPNEIAPSELASFLLHDIYEIYGHGRKPQRTDFFSAVADEAFRLAFSGSRDALDLADDLGRAVAGRHVQVYSRAPDEREAFELIGVGGRFADGDGDIVALTANNVVGGKMDVHLRHQLEAELQLEVDETRLRAGQPTGRRRGPLRVTVGNPLPEAGMNLAIIGNCLPGRCFDGPTGWNRTWFTLWAHERSPIRAVNGSDGETNMRATVMHGLRAFDRFLETPPEGSAWFELDLDSPVELRRDGPDLVYRLSLWRQAKAIPDEIDLTIAAPQGWSVTDATIDGGGEPEVAGFASRGGQPLTVSVNEDATAVSVTGAMTADATIEIRYTRPLLDRLIDWLRQPAW